MTLDSRPIGVIGEIRPDGTAELILNDYGRYIYGPHVRIIVTHDVLAPDEPVKVDRGGRSAIPS